MDAQWQEWERVSRAEGRREAEAGPLFVVTPGLVCHCGCKWMAVCAQAQIRAGDEAAAVLMMCRNKHVTRY
jgi:hypothetical protein